jgi:hypothetical protein
MNFDEYFDKLQKAWQCQHPSAKLNINANADVLLKEVRRNQQQWGAVNLWDAVLQIGGGFLMTLFFSYHGLRHASWTPFRLPNWDFLLVAFACAGVGTFRLVDRIVQRRKQTTANDPLKACIEASLNEVHHDIWLQRNVFWWCLLPFTTALAVSFGYGSLRAHNPIFLAFLVLFVIPLDWAGYRLSRFNVRKVLEPRRQELQTLLASLNENS